MRTYPLTPVNSPKTNGNRGTVVNKFKKHIHLQGFPYWVWRDACFGRKQTIWLNIYQNFKKCNKKWNQRIFNNTSLPEKDKICAVPVKQKSNYQLFDYNFYKNLPSRKQLQWITREGKPFWSISTERTQEINWKGSGFYLGYYKFFIIEISHQSVHTQCWEMVWVNSSKKCKF